MNSSVTNKRSAFTLIELSVTMATGSTLMMLAIGLVHQSMTLSSIGRERCDHQRTINRLASQFRRDVHRALQCTVQSPGSIQLILPDGDRISYEARANRLTRLQPLGVAGTRREVFEFHQRSSVTFESIDQPTRAVVTIVYRPQGTIEQPRLDLRVAAVVGRLTAHEIGDAAP
jgi:hypothetical protein